MSYLNKMLLWCLLLKIHDFAIPREVWDVFSGILFFLPFCSGEHLSNFLLLHPPFLTSSAVGRSSFHAQLCFRLLCKWVCFPFSKEYPNSRNFQPECQQGVLRTLTQSINQKHYQGVFGVENLSFQKCGEYVSFHFQAEAETGEHQFLGKYGEPGISPLPTADERTAHTVRLGQSSVIWKCLSLVFLKIPSTSLSFLLTRCIAVVGILKNEHLESRACFASGQIP